METLLWLIFWLGGLIGLAYLRVSIVTATAVIGAGLLLTTFFSNLSWLSLFVLWVTYGGVGFILNHPEYKKRFIIQPAFAAMSKTVPTLSDTEKMALEAGTIGWDGELFTGRPQWEKLLTIPAPKLSDEEQAFLEGPVKELCEMVSDWEVTHQLYDLPEKVWTFLKEQGFFALIIPKKYGGKGFSAFAHSEILSILAGRSLTLSSTVSVPNSLGPAELLLHYGTEEQRNYYLPRLAKGEEIPCFALTGPEAGSDASSITDTGIICQGNFKGKEITGIRLNWNKRYITLAPVATLLGMAFKLYDPDGLLGDEPELGITCALIPINTPGISIGRRHLPLNIPFQNGPTQGEEVFIPLDWIIGGAAMAGQGWRMLMECLATGRAISLPSASIGGAKMAALVSGAYSKIRRQFRTSLSSFEGVQEVLGRMGGLTYLCDAIRCLTVAMIDAGERPAVPGAIAKYHVTELGRQVANDAMDIHGGKAIMMGPSNYLGRSYQGVPIGITVEGANILTRNMIIFGQGAVRCHPYLQKEIQALAQQNMAEFEHYFGQHISFTLSNAAGALFHGLTFARFASSPTSRAPRYYYQQLARASSAFALVADISMALFGGKLKFKETVSARLGDLLAMMFMISAVLKRYEDQGTPEADLPLVRWSVDFCLARFWRTMDNLLRNLPQRMTALGLRIIILPFGIPCQAPKDKLNHQITELLTSLCDSRARLIGHSFISQAQDDSIAILEKAFTATLEHHNLLKRVYDAVKSDQLAQGPFAHTVEAALASKIISEQEAAILQEIDTLQQAAIRVDDFAIDELARSQEEPLPHKRHRTKSGSIG